MPGDDPRSGRWQGFDKVECGLHVPDGQTGYDRLHEDGEGE
jgi:phosphoadenosine phosphosulfate reductase